MLDVRVTRHAVCRLKERFPYELGSTPAIRKWNDKDTITSEVISECRRLIQESKSDRRFLNNQLFLYSLMEEHGFDNDYDILEHPTIGAKFLLKTDRDSGRKVLLTVLGKSMQGEFKRKRCNDGADEQQYFDEVETNQIKVNYQSVFGEEVTYVQNGYPEILAIRDKIIYGEYQQYIDYQNHYRIIELEGLVYCVSHLRDTIAVFGRPVQMRLEKWLDEPRPVETISLISNNVFKIDGDKRYIFCNYTFKVYEVKNDLITKIFNLVR